MYSVPIIVAKIAFHSHIVWRMAVTQPTVLVTQSYMRERADSWFSTLLGACNDGFQYIECFHLEASFLLPMHFGFKLVRLVPFLGISIFFSCHQIRALFFGFHRAMLFVWFLARCLFQSSFLFLCGLYVSTKMDRIFRNPKGKYIWLSL